MAFDLRSSELEHNFIKERISCTEKYLAEISSKLSSYIKNLASLRDGGDAVAKSISSFASKETYNQSLRLSLGQFSDVLSLVQEYCDAEINRTQVKIIDGLNCYHQLCTDAKNEIKKCFEARVKELKKKVKLEKDRSKNLANWQKVEREVNEAQEEAARMTQAMVKLVERFERKKLEDLKHIFLEFIKIEMIFHAKAIELYTKSYNIIKEISVEDDLEEFTSNFKAYSSNFDMEAASRISLNTVPKMIDETTESSANISHKPQVLGAPRELEHNFIKERISCTEKHLVEISSKLSSYIKNLASLRDVGDAVAKSISSFASKETYNQSLRLSLGKFSDVLSSVQDYRDAEVNRTQVKIIDGLNCYHQLCTDAKNEIKKCFEARVKELKIKNELQKARSKNPPNWQKIAQAEREVNEAQEEAARMTQAMVKLVERFERKKLEDLKHIFLEFVNIEMMFHAKALELHTKSYNIIKEIIVEDDLQKVTSLFKVHSTNLDMEAVSPISLNTVPKRIDETTESSANVSHKPQVLGAVQGSPRSVFTLKATVPKTIDTNSSFEGFVESKYESRD